MQITVVKKATKTKPEEVNELTFINYITLENFPSHYRLLFVCEECNCLINVSVGNWKKKKIEKKFLCQSCSIKNEWKRDDYKIKHGEAISKAFQAEEKKQTRSKISKANWKNKEYKSKTLTNLRRVCSSQKNKDNLSKIQIARWQNKEWREKFLLIIESEIYKHNQKKGCQKKWEDVNFQKKQMNRQWGYIKGLRFGEIYCRSFAEYAYLKSIETQYEKIESCDFYVTYLNKNGEKRRYFPDFKLTTVDGSVFIIEVKGAFLKEIKPLEGNKTLSKKHNKFSLNLDEIVLKAKLEALENYCQERGWSFKLETFDNKEFYNYYKTEYKKRKYENSKNNTTK